MEPAEIQNYAYGMWIIAAFNVGLFMFFILSFIKPRINTEWRSMSVVVAFLVALFAEMYGFPLTIFLLTGWLGDAYPVLEPFNHQHGHLLAVALGGSTIAWALVMALSLMFLLAGYMLMSKGWQQIHAAKGVMVTDGLYAYVRHPQYTGLFLMTVGFMIQWPTLLTLIMWPVLLFAYYRLARSEERRSIELFGETYKEYAQHTTPAFFPPVSKWKAFIMTKVDEEISTE